MTVTIYGGSDTSYAENQGAALGSVTGTVWQDEAKTQPLVDLRDANGNTTNVVTTSPNGHYKFGVNGYNGSVFLDFGLGPHRVWPADVAERLVAAEALITSQAAQITALQTAPAALSFADNVPWAASTAWVAGQFRTEPNGDVVVVTTAYSSGLTYGAADDANAKIVLSAPITQAQATTLYAPIGMQLAEHELWIGDPLHASYNPNPNGTELQASTPINALLAEIDDVGIGGPTTVMVYRFRPSGTGAGLLALGLLTIPDSKVSPAAALVLGATTFSGTTASGSATVTATGVAATHQGQPVTGPNIPTGSFVGTVTPGASFKLSSSPVSQVDVSATAAGTGTINVAPAVTCNAHDRLLSFVLNIAPTYAGAGLKVRVGVGSTTFTIPTAPTTPTGFAVSTSTSTSIAFTWTPGTGHTEVEVWKNNRHVATVFYGNTWTDTDVAQGGSADYKLLPRCPGAVGAFTAVVTASPTATWSLMPQATAGVWDTTKFSTTLGTNTGAGAGQGAPSATVDAASGGHQFAHLRSGSLAGTTTNDPQDRALVKVIVDNTARRAWGVRALLTPLNTATLLELYFGAAGIFNLTTGSTDFLRSTLTPNGISLEGKAASYDPTGEGSTTQGTTVGSFQRFTGSDYQLNLVTGATRTASGTIPFPSAMNVGTYNGVKVIADAVSGGRQLVSFYYGNETQYGTDGSGLPLLFTVNLTARFVTARAAGQFYMQQLGKQTSPTAVEGWDFKDYLDITPIAA